MSADISSLAPGVMVDSAVARVAIAPAPARFSLRARGASLKALGAALGLHLPEGIGRRSSAGAVEVIRLGPDEWTLRAPPGEADRLSSACAAVYEEHPHSLVDISGREVTLLIEGPKAAELMTLGCPRDIDAIAVGQGRRTVFDGTSVVLWRDADDCFRMDVWNSFAGYVAHLLETGCKELAAEHA